MQKDLIKSQETQPFSSSNAFNAFISLSQLNKRISVEDKNNTSVRKAKYA